MSEPTLTRRIGVAGATIMLVGFVIGVSIFILPGTLAASTGPAVIFSYFIASLMAVFSCVIAAQIGAAFPVSGASFVAISRLLSPFWGFIAVWMIIGAGAVAVALLAYGFADYMEPVWPVLDRRVVALSVVLALGGLNMLGVRDTVAGQGLMVGVFMIALIVFCVIGFANVDPQNLRPFMPNGIKPVLFAAIPAFFSYTGFMVIVEIGGEIRDPARNVPRALAFSFTTVLVTYTLVGLTVVGVVPWQELGSIAAPVHEASSRVLPPFAATAIALTALAAAASSINILLLGYSRDLFALAKAGILPATLARLSKRRGEPANCVMLFAGVALVAVAVGGRITNFAILTVVGLLFLQIAIGLAAIRLPRAFGQRYQALGFRLSRPALAFFGGGLIVFSLLFLTIVLMDSPEFIVRALAYVGTGAVYYLIRRHRLAGQGGSLEQNILDDVNGSGH